MIGNKTRFLISIVLLLLFGCSPKQQTPLLTVPTKVMALPNPNGFDALVKVGKLGRINAKKFKKLLSKAYKPSIEELRAADEANAQIFRELQRITSIQYLEPPLPSMSSYFPYYADFRVCCRLLALDSEYYKRLGQYDVAMERAILGLKIANLIPRGAIVIGRLVGIACDIIARKKCFEIIDHLDAKHTQTVLNELLLLSNQKYSISDTLKNEGDLVTKSIGSIKPNEDYYKTLLVLYGDDPFLSKKKTFRQVSIEERKQLLAQLKQYFDALLSYSEKNGIADSKLTIIPVDPLAKILHAVYFQSLYKNAYDVVGEGCHPRQVPQAGLAETHVYGVQ